MVQELLRRTPIRLATGTRNPAAPPHPQAHEVFTVVHALIGPPVLGLIL